MGNNESVEYFLSFIEENRGKFTQNMKEMILAPSNRKSEYDGRFEIIAKEGPLLPDCPRRRPQNKAFAFTPSLPISALAIPPALCYDNPQISEETL